MRFESAGRLCGRAKRHLIRFDIPMMTPTAHAHGLYADLVCLAAQQRDRRRVIGLVADGLGGLLSLLGCGGGDVGVASVGGSTDGSAGSGTAGSSAAGNCSVIPTETAGPYPGDGSNRANGAVANVLTLGDIVRIDIRSSVGGLSGVAAGVAMKVTLTLVDTSNSCAALAGHAIYHWHCDREGRYSMYSSGVTNQNYRRGVQVTDALGQVTVQTFVPACYSGRWPHIHSEVFASLDLATRAVPTQSRHRNLRCHRPSAARCSTLHRASAPALPIWRRCP